MRAAFALLAGLTAIACQLRAQPAPATTVRALDDAVVFNGQINARSLADFLELLQQRQVTRLVITSRGGLVDAALDMALAIRERQLDVEVPSACLSSCANYIFPAGRRKIIGRPGAVAWHGNMAHVLYQQQTGQANWNESQLDEARRLARREAEFFQRIDVDGFICWFAKIEPYKIEDFYYLSVQDMEKFGLRDVTFLETAPPAVDNESLRLVRVDWATLESKRPALRLQE